MGVVVSDGTGVKVAAAAAVAPVVAVKVVEAWAKGKAVAVIVTFFVALGVGVFVSFLPPRKPLENKMIATAIRTRAAEPIPTHRIHFGRAGGVLAG